jgi:hypothetical protein
MQQMVDNSQTVVPQIYRFELVQLLFVVDSERRVNVNNLHSLQEQKNNIWKETVNNLC